MEKIKQNSFVRKIGINRILLAIVLLLMYVVFCALIPNFFGMAHINSKSAGVPIVAFDSGFPNAPEGTVLATIATDSYAAGRIAGEEMWKAIRDKVMNSDTPCRVGYVGQDTVSGSQQGRGLGFIDALYEAAANGETDKVVDYDCPAVFYNAENMNDSNIATNLYD